MLTGVFEDLKEIAAHQHFATTEREEECAGGGELIEHAGDLVEGHFAVIVMIEIAMNAALIAAIGDVELHAQRNVEAGPRGYSFPEASRSLGRPRKAFGHADKVVIGQLREELIDIFLSGVGGDVEFRADAIDDGGERAFCHRRPAR